ncbi:MAG: formylglycine-generating enzyme family protein [Saprospiraceae bacterium]|nr:formylglycine-generating enzyme family protein [Saprospiraceae bacterium]MCB9356463.1 formylglycine-generating enzyme family protein [Lewinellaceae bacterium]
MTDPHKEIVNGCEFRMIYVAGGAFEMGSPDNDTEADSYEKPRHRVKVSDFYVGKYPVTQALWKAVMDGENPSVFKGDDRPIEQVSWNDAQGFIKRLNELTDATRPQGHLYRLPTESEWEYTARGGKYHAEGYKYAGSDRLKDVGWFDENSGKETKPVGQKTSNQLGLFDMNGNVWEWCEDDWHDNYNGAPNNGAPWVDHPGQWSFRVYRGGNFFYAARLCRVAFRDYNTPSYRYRGLGFRLALSLQ